MESAFDIAERLTRAFVARHATPSLMAQWTTLRPDDLFQQKELFRRIAREELFEPFAEAIGHAITAPNAHLDQLYRRAFYDCIRYLHAAAEEARFAATRRAVLEKAMPGLPE